MTAMLNSRTKATKWLFLGVSPFFLYAYGFLAGKIYVLGAEFYNPISLFLALSWDWINDLLRIDISQIFSGIALPIAYYLEDVIQYNYFSIDITVVAIIWAMIAHRVINNQQPDKKWFRKENIFNKNIILLAIFYCCFPIIVFTMGNRINATVSLKYPIDFTEFIALVLPVLWYFVLKEASRLAE